MRKIFHAVERHEEPLDKRKSRAWQSWDAVYQRGVIPCHLWKYPRTARSIGDLRFLPFIQDILRPALDQAADEDIVFLTNDDDILHPGLPEALYFHVSLYGPCCSQRIDFGARHIPLDGKTPNAIVQLGKRHYGRDLFAGTKAWWISILDQFGDPIAGASDWDYHLCAIVRLHYGIHTTRQNVREHISPAELQLGYVAHQIHTPVWQNPRNESGAASQRHNRMNFKRWAAKYLPMLRFDKEGRI